MLIFIYKEQVDSGEVEDYQALTEKEEQDLICLMEDCGFTVSNAEAFMETLAKDLSILDGVSNFLYLKHFKVKLLFSKLFY